MTSKPNEASQNYSSTNNEMSLFSSSKEIEITRDEALRSLLKNDELSDLTLRGTDGVCVTANRCLLASRSPVFHRMLFGQFKEATKTEIDVGYDGKILQAILEYIYTDTLIDSSLDWSSANDEDDRKKQKSLLVWNLEFVNFLMTLISAANYFALPKLRQFIEKEAKEAMKHHHEVAALFLTVCTPPSGDDDTTTDQVLLDGALEMIEKHPEIIVNGKKDIIAKIHPSIIEIIVKDDEFPLNEFSFFQIVQSWANAEQDNEEEEGNNAGRNDEQESNELEKPNRKRMAAQMINHIHLEDIDTEELSTSVSTSGLVTAEQLCNAYKRQALRASKQLRTTTTPENLRRGSVWCSTGTTVFKYDWTRERGIHCSARQDVILRQALKSGVHKWSIKVLSGAEYIELGVAPPSWEMDPEEYLSYQKGGWSLSSDNGEGIAKHAIETENELVVRGLPTFSNGSTVSFTLDLDNGEGILTASIDGNPSFQVFSGMLAEHENNDGFAPAILGYIWRENDTPHAEFLGFETVS